MRSAVLILALATSASAAEADTFLTRIKAVAKEGSGNQEAGAAWKSLVELGGSALMPTLAALDDASPVASNWLRSAANAVAEKEVAAGKKLPAAELETFAKDTKHSPIARRIAYELLVEVDAKAPERLLPGFINDASSELRRDAIAVALVKADKLEGDAAKAELSRLFPNVRAKDQAEKIAKSLAKLGSPPDLIKSFGFVTKWHVVGPFDNTKGEGFTKVYDPEVEVDLKAKYRGKGDAEITWKPHTVIIGPDEFELDEKVGIVNLNKVLDKHKYALAYAHAVVESETERPVEIRFASITSIKVFLNGKEVFARDEYHHGQRFDQYTGLGTLKAGKNEILVKVCQNDQKEPWAQNWQFQLRICDATGGAVPVK